MLNVLSYFSSINEKNLFKFFVNSIQNLEYRIMIYIISFLLFLSYIELILKYIIILVESWNFLFSIIFYFSLYLHLM